MSVVLGRVRFTVSHSPVPAMERYGASRLAGVPAVMAASEQRVYQDVFAHTPVDTGHMQANLLKTSDIAPVETEYSVFWRPQEFLGQVNPRGEIINSFYPASLILGDRLHAARYPNLGTEELEAERPRLVRDLAEHFSRAT